MRRLLSREEPRLDPRTPDFMLSAQMSTNERFCSSIAHTEKLLVVQLANKVPNFSWKQRVRYSFRRSQFNPAFLLKLHFLKIHIYVTLLSKSGLHQ
jgi:hypothetical protein